MKLPVLLYHHVGPPRPGTSPGLTIPPQQFERHVRWLVRRGFVGIRPSDWLAWCRNGLCLPERPVLFTFDDAYADVAEYALPLIKHYGFSAAVFVVTGRTGGTNTWDEERGFASHKLMSVEQIRYWAVQGIEFGAHSRTHVDLRMLTSEQLAEEVAGSKKDLAEILGAQVVSFAYGYGLYNEVVCDAVREMFDLAFTTEEGLNHIQTDRHLLRRNMVFPNDSIIDFSCSVRFGWNPIRRFRARVLKAARHLAGICG